MAGTQEGELCNIEIKRLVLPNGVIKSDVLLNTDYLVGEEKERILREADIPYPILYIMVLYGPHGSYRVLDDSLFLKSYSEDIGGGEEYEIHIQKKSSQVERPPRPAKPELFNVQLK